MSGRQRVTARAIVLGFLAALYLVKVADGLHGGPGVVTAITALFLVQLPYVVPRAEPFRARHWVVVLAAQAVLTYLPFVLFREHWIAGVSGLLGGSLLLAMPGRISWLGFGAVVGLEVVLGITVLGSTGPAEIGYLVTATSANGLALYGLVRLAGIADGHHREAGRAATHLARMVIALLCVCYAVQELLDIRAFSQVGGVLLVIAAAVTAVVVLLQVHHSQPRAGIDADTPPAKPGGWPWTVAVQAVLVTLLVSIVGWSAYPMAGLVFGSSLLLVRSPWWALPCGLILAGGLVVAPPPQIHPGNHLYLAATVVAAGLAVYGLSRMAELTVRPPS